MRVDRLDVSVFEIPTESRESDGTLSWNSTTMVFVEIHAAGVTGAGYTYGHSSAAHLIRNRLAEIVEGARLEEMGAIWLRLCRSCRNLGREGVAATAISGIDLALWDLKCKLFGQPLASVIGQVRSSIPVYGSAGFTSLDIDRVQRRMADWVSEGIRMVKMKVGEDPGLDSDRVAAVRNAIGTGVELFVDANGAFTPREALAMAEKFAKHEVTWFEEPVSSDDLDGLAFVRGRCPPGMAIAAGEYGWDPWYFHRLLRGGAVDVIQVDITRCCGLTGLLKVAGLCESAGVPMSSHTAPSAHAHALCSLPAFKHAEYFHDHVRIEEAFFDGFPRARNGRLAPDLSRPGLGIEIRKSESRRFAT